MIGAAKKRSFSDDVMEAMGKGPGQSEDGEDGEHGVEMDDEEEEDGDESAHEDRVMAVKQFGKAIGVEIADPEKAAEALKTFMDSCY